MSAAFGFDAISNALASCDLPNEVALSMFNRFGFLVIQDCPSNVEFGCDLKSWTVTDQFCGMKLIPPGTHYFFISVGSAPRIGFFKHFTGNDLVFMKWDKKNETFTEKEPTDEELDRVMANIYTLDKNLAVYQCQDLHNWIKQINFIQQSTCERLKPSNLLGLISGQPEAVTKEEELAKTVGKEKVFNVDRENPERVRFKDPNGLPIMKVKKEYEIPFTPIAEVPFTEDSKFRAGIDNTDKLYLFAQSLGNDYSQVLAEFQYSFVIFLVGQVYDGFVQWKRLMHLFCSCRGALITQPKFYLELLMVLYFQIKMCPDDFFVDVLSKDNFLSTTLSWFFANVEDSPSFLNKDLRTKAGKVKAFFAQKFKKSFDLPRE